MHIECLASDPWKSADKNTVCVSVHLLVCVRVCMRDENAKDNSDSKANDTTRNKNKQIFSYSRSIGRGKTQRRTSFRSYISIDLPFDFSKLMLEILLNRSNFRQPLSFFFNVPRHKVIFDSHLATNHIVTDGL